MELLTLNLQLPADAQRLESVWEMSTHREPQAHPAYVRFVSRGHPSLCALVEPTTGHGSVMMPFLVRPIPHTDGLRDAITPYGYGGAYVDGSVDAEAFWLAFDEWADREGIIGLTVRGHLFEEETLACPGLRHAVMQNVVMDTTRGSDEVWGSVEGRVRTDARRARREGVVVRADPDCEEIEEFHRLYTQSMTRAQADDYYFFSERELEELVTGMGAAICLFNAYHDGKIVASEMQLLGTRNAYYFLSGGDDVARSTRANQLMKLDVAQWLHERGIERYVLGGGMRAGDSLFAYKKAYAPKNVLDFKVFYHDISPETTESLVRDRRRKDPLWEPVSGYYPLYRAPGRPVETP